MDDFGGWYDHVRAAAQYGCDATTPYGLGFRLPLIFISPYAKPGFVYSSSRSKRRSRASSRRSSAPPSLRRMDPAAQDGPDTDDLMLAFDWTQTPLPPLRAARRATAPAHS